MKRDKLETIILLFCIVVLLALSFRTLAVAQNLSCDECTITFKDKKVYETKMTQSKTTRIDKLFESYAYEDVCLVTWDPVGGYVYKI